MKTHAKHLFFDMDDTVTLSRSTIDDDMYELLNSLEHDIIIVSGAHANQISDQMKHLPLFLLGQNGNQALTPERIVLWEEKLSNEHTETISNHIRALRTICELSVKNEDDLVEHRGAQISYSLIGHHEDTMVKKACDPEQKIRRQLLEEIPLLSDDIEIKIGGTTCFDYFMKGRNKGYNVNRLIQDQGWEKENCLYFGDALFPGGNDETVIGIIDTVPVTDHRHTYELLKEHFA